MLAVVAATVSAPADATPLRLVDALAEVDAASPELRVAEAAATAAHAAIGETTAERWPQLEIGVRGRSTDDPSEAFATALADLDPTAPEALFALDPGDETNCSRDQPARDGR